ncbi:MAG: hypothetical protein ABIZ70_04715 [Gemmatimonadales bacterium]
MEPIALPWLDSLIGAAASISIVLLVVINGAFALGIALGNRSLVQRWTKPLVVADTILIGTAIGAPVIGIAAKLGLKGLGLLAVKPIAAATAATVKGAP